MNFTYLKPTIFLTLITVTVFSHGCGITVPMLSSPEVIRIKNDFDGIITKIEKPVNIHFKCCKKFEIRAQAMQESDDGLFSAFNRVRAYGQVKKSDDDNFSYFRIKYDEFETDLVNFANKYEIAANVSAKKGKHGFIWFDNIKVNNLDKASKTNESKVKEIENGIKWDMWGWLNWILYLPDTPIATGTTLDLSGNYQFYLTTGRERFPHLLIQENNSYVAGKTIYGNSEHAVFIIDLIAYREGEGYAFFSAKNPLKVHIVGYILVDINTGFHSLGNLKSRMAIQHHTKTAMHTVDYEFSVNEII